MSANFIDTVDALTKMVDDIVGAVRPPFVFVDLEGINLSRHGSISILQILVPPSPVVHLVDVFTLQARAFNSTGTKGKTLKDVLESAEHVKVFFDVRHDSDALFSHFGVDLKGVVDLQLVEYASRPYGGKTICGLARCISQDLNMSFTERNKLLMIKEAGLNLFAPERGGAYAKFNERPLPEALREYCVQDVMVLPKLLLQYAGKLQDHMAVQVIDESQKRVLDSQAAHFNGNGRHMALAPAFRRTRPLSVRVLQSPFDTLCSPNLRTFCIMDDVKAILEVQEAPLVTSTVQSVSSVSSQKGSLHDPISSLLQDLGNLRMAGGLRLGKDDEADEDENDWVAKLEADDIFEDPNPWDGGSSPDYTACSASDCGYCGNCGY